VGIEGVVLLLGGILIAGNPGIVCLHQSANVARKVSAVIERGEPLLTSITLLEEKHLSRSSSGGKIARVTAVSTWCGEDKLWEVGPCALE
jgi:hypothetical protein